MSPTSRPYQASWKTRHLNKAHHHHHHAVSKKNFKKNLLNQGIESISSIISFAYPRAYPFNRQVKLKRLYRLEEKKVAKSLIWQTCGENRPLSSSKNPHFQNEARCTTFLVKMSFICMRMKNDFHIIGWAPTLVLKQRSGGTWKWPASATPKENPSPESQDSREE